MTNHTNNNKVAVDRLVLDRVRQQASTRWGAVAIPSPNSLDSAQRSTTRRIPPSSASTTNRRSLRESRTTATGSVGGSRSLRESRTAATSSAVANSRSRSREDPNRTTRSTTRRPVVPTTSNTRSKSSSQLLPDTTSSRSHDHGSPSSTGRSHRRPVYGRSSPSSSMSRSCSSIDHTTSSPSPTTTRRRGGRRRNANNTNNHTTALKGLQAIIAVSENSSPRKVPNTSPPTTTSRDAATAKMRKTSLLLQSLGHSTKNKFHLSSPQLIREEEQQDIKERNRSIVQGFLQKEPTLQRRQRPMSSSSRIANHAA